MRYRITMYVDQSSNEALRATAQLVGDNVEIVAIESCEPDDKEGRKPDDETG